MKHKKSMIMTQICKFLDGRFAEVGFLVISRTHMNWAFAESARAVLCFQDSVRLRERETERGL